jgi:hypothetical protein
MSDFREWTRLTRVQGDGGGGHYYIRGEYLTRMLKAADIEENEKDLHARVERIYGLRGDGWIILNVRKVGGRL